MPRRMIITAKTHLGRLHTGEVSCQLHENVHGASIQLVARPLGSLLLQVSLPSLAMPATAEHCAVISKRPQATC